MKQVVTGVLAWLVLAGILIGLPALLVALGGTPIPSDGPTLQELGQALTTPDDGTLVLGALKLLGWLVWAALTATILVELVAQVRGLPAPSIPALGLPQATARSLVTAALALFVASPTLASPAFAGTAVGQPDSAATPTVSVSQPEHTPGPEAEQSGPSGTATEQATNVPTVTYTVAPGDTLWSIAVEHLGAGEGFDRIVELNRTVLTEGADWLTPGMRLHLPDEAPTAAGDGIEQGRYVVVEGDTLSAIAAKHLGDGDRWPEIFEASQGIEQPDGQHLTDPDLIYAGWRLTIPDVTAAVTPAPSPPGEEAKPAPVQEADPPGEDLAQISERSGQAGATVGAMAAATVVPAAPTAPVESESGAGAGALAQLNQDTTTDGDDGPAWLLPGLVGSGSLLSGGMLVVLAARRRAQFRNRRPGRTITAPEPALAPVEMTVQTIGRETVVTLEDLDDILRRLGSRCATDGIALPVLTAVHLTQTHLTLHLAEPAGLGAPWSSTPDQLHWTLPAETPRDEVGPATPGHRAPYPLLASIGAADDGSRWLLNLEDLETSITGQDEYVHDVARYLAAEIAVNPWSAGVRLECVGVAEEVVAMNPARVHAADTQVLGDAVAGIVGVVDRLEPGTDTPTARATHAGEDTWPARMVMITAQAAAASTDYTQLAQLLSTHEGRTSAAVVVTGATHSTHATQLIATADGRVLLPDFGLDLVAVGLTDEEAKGCAALLAQGEQVQDAPMPARDVVDDAAEGWRAWSDEAGALRPEHTVPGPAESETELEETSTLLPEPEESYLAGAATTPVDLDALAPHVSADVAQRVAEADPTLDEDLHAWWAKDGSLPRLTLMGAVGARTRGKPLVDRKPYFTELLAYLALRPHGATVEETAEAFGLNPGKTRDYIGRCREWLGTNPRTGELHLPHAAKAPAAKTRGVNVYQVVDVLVDVDLFRRLRVRGQARGGPAGMADLRQALQLVQGRPFSQLRSGGWGWLFEGDRLDIHIVCAIVDVAHVVAVADLERGDTAGARLAAEVAALAAPDEEIPTLDLAAVTHAEGHSTEAVKLLQGQVCNRVEDEDTVPGELPERTQQILDRHRWLDQREAG